MKSFIVLAMLVAVALASPVNTNDKDAVIVRSELDNIGVEGFNYNYETSNGIAAQADGQLTNVGSENEALVVRGQFSYTGTDGVLYTVTYEAGPDGFKPQGAHLPQSP